MSLLRLLCDAAVIIGVGYYLASFVAALRFAKRAATPPAALPKVARRVAILKPLHGTDQSLAANLLSFLEVAYPRLDYFFGVSSYDDPAAEVPVALRARYQFANITLLVGEEPDCANRKIAKVIKMADRAEKADIFVMSDADITVDRDYLLRIVSEIESDDRVGIVTCPYRARPSGSFMSRLEALFVNTDFTPQVLLSSALEPMHHALGATVAIKRDALESIGGFRAVRDLLADDFYLGRFVTQHGWRVRLSDSLVTLTFEETRLSSVWRRQLRWARTVRWVRPVSIGTIFCHASFWALLLMLFSGFSAASIGVLVGVVALRVGISAVIIARVLKLPGLVRDAWMVPLKDLLAAAIWLVSLFGNEVVWGGERFRSGRDGMMRAVTRSARRAPVGSSHRAAS
ncbi:MAG TPA: bacteriohopanetetrol glucosamine biosynthesis glycosyltransferase HpnI [Candidatus Binataceae bacterium]|nr:bacteriohopanetetrol glucosamine biosynthesis glycosyltransferase HpnI [Candidatus Binataceae bacterium]